MTVKEHIIESTGSAGKKVFERARAVPQDKLSWQPLGEGRTVLSLVQECAQCPLWTVDVLKNFGYKPGDGESELETLPTELDELEAMMDRNVLVLYDAIRAFPEARMSEQITIPWGTFTFTELMDVAHWNFTYHEGQINYIQTLYGDKSY